MVTSPLQNRVMPTGEIVSTPSRGLLMGNRGCIHRPERTLGTSRWRSKLWISCVLSWQGVRRDVMPPGRWTALFFLDEVTALAAGHRPCGYCRLEEHRMFGECWRVSKGLAERPLAAEMNMALHAERVDRRTRRQVIRPWRLGALPDGAMVRHNDTLSLVAGGRLLPWSFEGYGEGAVVAPNTVVELLTPPTIIGILAAGYRPMVHPSAGSSPYLECGLPR